MSGDSNVEDLIVVGVSHKTAPLYIRERLAFKDDDQRDLIKQLNVSPLDGLVLLSTCNRVEIYSVLNLAQHDGETHGHLHPRSPLFDQMVSQLASRGEVDEAELYEHLYVHRGDQALTHLFRVASSLDSLVVGESQILGQLKSAFELSHSQNTSGRVSHYMEQAFNVARRIRRETGIGQYVVSVSSVAVRLARHIFEDLSERSVLLVGAGEMGELAARHLCQEGVGRLLVANRNLARATELSKKLGGYPRDLNELPKLLEQADIVITSTGARKPIITPKLAQRVIKARKYRPIFLIDIAVPRNVDPRVNKLDNIYVYDVDDLTQLAEDNLAQRQAEANSAESLIHAEIERFHSARAQRSLGPTIAEVRARVHQLKEQELAWVVSKSGGFNQDQEELMRRFGERLANKVLHDIIMGMKSYANQPERSQMLELVSKLFALEDDSPSDQS